jgi:hypothetical protein
MRHSSPGVRTKRSAPANPAAPPHATPPTQHSRATHEDPNPNREASARHRHGTKPRGPRVRSRALLRRARRDSVPGRPSAGAPHAGNPRRPKTAEAPTARVHAAKTQPKYPGDGHCTHRTVLPHWVEARRNDCSTSGTILPIRRPLYRSATGPNLFRARREKTNHARFTSHAVQHRVLT